MKPYIEKTVEIIRDCVAEGDYVGGFAVFAVFPISVCIVIYVFNSDL